MPAIFPLYFLRFEVWQLPFTVPEILVYLLFAGFVLTGGMSKEFVRQIVREKIFWAAAVFFLAAVISTFIVPESIANIDGGYEKGFDSALGMLKGWIFMPLLYALMVYSVKEKKILVLSLLISGVWLSMWALWQVVSGDFVTIDGRASAFYESANYLALYLGPICVLWGVFFLKVSRVGHFLGLGLLAYLALFFSASYAGWIAVFAGLGFYLILSKNFTRKFKVSAVAMVLLAFLIFGFSQVGSEKMEGFFEFEERSSTSARLQIWDASISMIGDHPVLGVGLGQFQVNYQWKMKDLYWDDTYEWLMPHPHNFFMGIWLNFGLLGLVAMVWLLILAFSRVKSDFQMMIAAALFAVIIHGCFDMPFMKNDLALQFWLLILLLL